MATDNGRRSHGGLKWGASSRWSFNPDSAWDDHYQEGALHFTKLVFVSENGSWSWIHFMLSLKNLYRRFTLIFDLCLW